ncbi:agrin-like protein [Dinothrombium tinctorium]|uniref:Agrin-like protein n=1 Tax=Dinothrombium tinctorium TaxID=1965070 RepID=A0A3S3PK58_9ACAR|nr:agrin-like protein [Dinothrombium tinctorium]RWS11363.1 agrin-like protein [Dinothrombium tinctorium]RWS11366.1 agrin-like protein [Dinothrombium tinctorium]
MERASKVNCVNGCVWMRALFLLAIIDLHLQPAKACYKFAKGVKDPCLDMKCRFGENCVRSKDGKKAECVCPEKCYTYGDSVGSRPVCGTDGRDYPNECELRRRACKNMKDISVKFQGRCEACKSRRSLRILHNGSCNARGANPCEELKCGIYEECDINLEGKAKCTCPLDCPAVLKPVCGSDGATYDNECDLRRQACVLQKQVTLAYKGLCGEEGPCHGFKCEFGAYCVLKNNEPSCECASCSEEFRPVCGSDGITYSNECKMKKDACEQRKLVHLAYQGFCNGCENKNCEHYSLCESDGKGNGRYIGSGGGYVKTCDHNTCRYGGECDYDHFGIPHCICSYHCPSGGQENEPVCGSDGRLYENECKLQEEACRRQQEIKPEDHRLCQESKILPCDGEPPLIDLTTGREYYCGEGPDSKQCPASSYSCACNYNGSVREDCEQMTGRCVCKHGLQGMKCDVCPENAVLNADGCTDLSLMKSFAGLCSEVKCRFGAACKERSNNEVQCVCDIKCPASETGGQVIRRTSSVICASDSNTYVSECQLRLYACRIQRKIYKIHDGHCKPSASTGGRSGGSRVETVTVGPVRRSTVFKTTLQDTDKSTRELTLSVSEQVSTKPTAATPTLPETPITVPSFNGESFIEMQRLQAYTRLSIELEFISYTENAILLYNGQTASGEGDFVSLSIKAGFLEFRYNLGSGTVILRSSKKLVLGAMIKVVAKRYLRDGMLTVEGHEDVAGKSDGDLKSLDLAENLYFGDVSNKQRRVFENIGVKQGFVGCLYKLRIGRKDVDIRYPGSKDIIKVHNVHDCEDMPCTNNPCKNGGICLPERAPNYGSYSCSCDSGFTGKHCEIEVNPCGHENPCMKGATCTKLPQGGFSCLCPPGKTGKLCADLQREMHHVFVPDFWGSSYLQLPTLQNVAQAFVIEVWFLTRVVNGLLLYNGQYSPIGRGDFLSLNIVDGQIQFRYNLGSGIPNVSGVVILTSKNKVSLGEWHTLRITRQRKKGTLQLNDGPVEHGEAKGNLSELNLDQPLYIGGIDDIYAVNKDSGIVVGLNGAIQRIVVNGEIWDNLVQRATAIKNVPEYSGPPCGYENPCINEGICVPQLNDYNCKCKPKFTGKKCNKLSPKEESEKTVSNFEPPSK